MIYLATNKQYPVIFTPGTDGSHSSTPSYPRMIRTEELLSGDRAAIKFIFERGLGSEEVRGLRHSMNSWRGGQSRFSVDLKEGDPIVTLHTIPGTQRPLAHLRAISILLLRAVQQ